MTTGPDEHGLWHWSHGDIGAVFSGAAGDYGVSTGPYATCNVGLHRDDDVARVVQNRRSITRLGQVPAGRVVQARQVHGTTVARTDRDGGQLVDWTLGQTPSIDADAIVITDETIAAAILVADCMPVVVAGRHSAAVVHAGWRSLVGGVLEAAAAE
ncbi:MAG: laccase domain-containing protein, partial [Thermoleophilia bacterium]|nr:laccase domain-containing protein [Thermoleophilia bacterium]